ncbi:MAG: hypothetical protein K1V80_08140 [Muribaculaceae bacterium]
MPNKRQLKKRISYVCGDLAGDLILSSYYVKGIDRNQVNKILTEIAELQEDSRAKVSFGFDKARKSFENEQAYNRARRSYNKSAFLKLRKEFADRAIEIVKQMNELIPADVRKSVCEY